MSIIKLSDKIMKLTSIAISYAQAGLSVVPTHPTGKYALVKWTPLQSRIADEEEIKKWYKDNPSASIACIGGAISGNLEIMDLDNHFGDAEANYAKFYELVSNTQPGLMERLVIERTQRGGFHILYRCDEPVDESSKIASRRNEATGRREATFETRGEKGYAIVAPSPGYELIQGDITDIPTITSDERKLLLCVALDFDETDEKPEETAQIEPVGTVAPPPLKKADVRPASGLKPGEDFNERGDITPILQNAGWVLLKEYPNGKQEWKRPGKKERGASATFNAQEGKMETPNKFFVFSSNALPFEQDRSYSKFEVFTILECNNDRKEAVRRLAALGYGEQTRKKSKGLNASVSGYDSPDVKKEAEEAEEEQVKRYNYTDVGNSDRFVDMWRNKLKYNHTFNKWHIWDSKRWKLDETNGVLTYAIETVRTILDDITPWMKEADRKPIKAWAKTSESSTKLTALLNIARSDPDMRITANDFDSYPHLINLGNGIYDLINNKLLEHNPDYLLSQITDINYDPDAECPYWDASLMNYFGNDQESVKFMQKACGITLYGKPVEEKFFFLYGSGKNGKSVFVNVLHKIFGEYGKKIDVQLLLDQKFTQSGGATDEIARLKGARFVSTFEMPNNRRLSENGMKNLTSKDKISARHLFQNVFEFYPSHTLWTMGNHKPKIIGGDEGTWRRVILVPFAHQVKDEDLKSDDELDAIWEVEKEGILAWMIEGWKLYQQEKLKMPEAIKKATEEYREDEDVLGDFLAECCDTSDPDRRINQVDLHDAYVKWCGDKIVPLQARTFNNALEERQFVRESTGHGRGRRWVGLALIEKTEETHHNPIEFP